MQLALVPCLLRTPLVARSAGATMLLLRALTASGGNALWPGAVTLLSASPGAAAPAMMQCMQHAAHARGLAAEALGTSTPSTSGASSSTSSSTEEWYFGDRPYYESEATRKRKLNLQYCQQRAAWRREMTVLRKQWTAEWRAERQREEERARQLKEEAAQLRAQRDEGKQRDRGLLRLEREIRDAERTVELVGGALVGRGEVVLLMRVYLCVGVYTCLC